MNNLTSWSRVVSSAMYAGLKPLVSLCRYRDCTFCYIIHNCHDLLVMRRCSSNISNIKNESCNRFGGLYTRFSFHTGISFMFSLGAPLSTLGY